MSNPTITDIFPPVEPGIDPQVFLQDLYTHHAASLLAYITRILGDQQQAEDVVQETMLRAWRHADRLTPESGPVHRWLSRVARNIAFDRIRARNARPTEVEENESTVQIAEDHSGAVVDSVLLAQALSGLSPKHREALTHVYLAGFSATETAELLGVPVGTVKTRVHHGLRRLRIRLAQERPAAPLTRATAPQSQPAATAPGPASSESPCSADVSRAG